MKKATPTPPPRDPVRQKLETAVDEASERCQRARVSLRLRERDFLKAREALRRYDEERKRSAR